MREVKTFEGHIMGMTKEELVQCTPEWNIEHYTKLLSITKKTSARRKIQKELKWWLDAKKWGEEADRVVIKFKQDIAARFGVEEFDPNNMEHIEWYNDRNNN